MFLEFELAAHVDVECPEPGVNGANRPLDPERIHIIGADKLADRQTAPMTVSPVGDSGYEMLQAVARFAFPATAAAYWKDEREPDRETMEHALRTDALRLIELTWRRCHAHRDPAAQLAIDLDASMRWIKSQCENLVTLARNANEAAEHVLGLASRAWTSTRPRTARMCSSPAWTLLVQHGSTIAIPTSFASCCCKHSFNLKSPAGQVRYLRPGGAIIAMA